MPHIKIAHDGEDKYIAYIHDHRMAEVTKAMLRDCSEDEIATMANTALEVFINRRGEI